MSKHKRNTPVELLHSDDWLDPVDPFEHERGHTVKRDGDRYRITLWLYDGDPNTHNSRYYATYGAARHAYMRYQLEQILETRVLEIVRFEKLCKDGKFHPMFESFVNHDNILY